MKNVFLGLACIAGLAACADGRGQAIGTQSYLFSGPGAYDQYRANREMALTGQAAIPHTIPKSYPFAAPTPEEIASPTAIQRARASTARAGQGSATGAGYYDPATGRNLSGGQAAVAPAAAATAAAVNDPLRRYAAAQSHPVGAIIYSRPRSSTATIAANVCATYPGAEAAQLAFLSKGGPQSDPLGMDPDGDGYVCGWDPTYYMPAR